ncbi:MAG: ATP-binding protein [Bacillota bacterium]|uniref:Ferredoxin n=1 Tax=Thermanaerosceptrum fracticalcis TaxID=1712410 RepID=A0A7G6E2C3_THEFR|nr:4Fe-4S binding protein [Thermanaerosceptrum fracticalcis]QNB46227.1 ferredoxin [Thermanaerosceptrum fracticalcis]
MAVRKIVKIDEEKCNGCGICVPACAEGAIQIIDGKARLLAENLCDGLGACLGPCPMNAITIEEREAEEFDEAAVEKHKKSIGREPHKHEHHETPKPVAPPAGGCPGSRLMSFRNEEEKAGTYQGELPSALRQWPVQLNLLPVTAPFFEGADLLLAADCVPLVYADFHRKFLKGKTVAMGCPKLDNVEHYLEKLTAIIKHNNLKSITVTHMEVPCCYGMVRLVQEAVKRSDKKIPVQRVKIGVRGEILETELMV